jgi:hypothetical protein
MVLAVAVGLVAAGIGAYVYHYVYADRGNSKITATIQLRNPAYGKISCGTLGNPIYFQISFGIASVSGTVTTSQFGIEVVNPLSVVIPPNTTAPHEESNLPCSAPIPNGWYMEYTDGPNGPWATFPWGPNGWSTGASGPITIHAHGWFDLVSYSDMTGTEDNVTAYGLNGANVTFTGQTEFPPWSGP